MLYSLRQSLGIQFKFISFKYQQKTFKSNIYTTNVNIHIMFPYNPEIQSQINFCSLSRSLLIDDWIRVRLLQLQTSTGLQTSSTGNSGTVIITLCCGIKQGHVLSQHSEISGRVRWINIYIYAGKCNTGGTMTKLNLEVRWIQEPKQSCVFFSCKKKKIWVKSPSEGGWLGQIWVFKLSNMDIWGRKFLVCEGLSRLF